MSSTATTSLRLQSLSAPRDHGVHRRAYLDTYARRRAGLSEAPVATQAETSTQQTATGVPVIAAPAAVAVAQDFDTSYMQPQPSSDSFVYTSAPTQVASMAPSQTTVQSTTRRTSYLDTLTQRHERAVAHAVAAEDTVFATSLSSETAELIEEPDHHAIEANLRALYQAPLTEQMTRTSSVGSSNHIRTVLASAFACGVIAVGVFSFVSRYDSQPVVAQPIGAPVIEVEASSQRPVSGSSQAVYAPVLADPSHPVRMVVSSIGVNAPVEGLGTTPEGLIAVPKSYGVVGWYNKGVVPGKQGSAILVGHYTGGNRGVFDNLASTKAGDLVTLKNGKGESFTYKITSQAEYDKDKVPMQSLFAPTNDARLHIITCAGKWQANNYNKRLVVSAELVR